MAWQLVREVIHRGPELRALSWGTDSRGRTRTMPHSAYVALLVIAEGCHEGTNTGRVSRALLAGALDTSERTVTKLIAELSHDDHQLVEQVKRGHVAPVYENGRRVGKVKRATLFRLTLAAIGGVNAAQEPPEASGAARSAQEPPGASGAGPSAPEQLRNSAEQLRKFAEAAPEAPEGSHIPVVSPGDSPGGEPAAPDLSDEPAQPCGRQHDPDKDCRRCGEARKADKQRAEDAAGAEAERRAAAARERREAIDGCHRCDQSGWIDDPHTAGVRHCRHESEPNDQRAPADRPEGPEPPGPDPVGAYAYPCPHRKCLAEPGQWCRKVGGHGATREEPHPKRLELAAERAA